MLRKYFKINKTVLKIMPITRKFFSSSIVGKSLVASMDQSLLSGINFFITIMLIKSVPKSEYGYYAIAFSISQLLISIQNALVTTPLSVLFAAKKGQKKRLYARSLCWGQLVVIVPAVLISLSIIIAFYNFGVSAIYLWIAGSLSLGCVGILFREFGRAYYFAEELPFLVLKLDIIYAMVISFLIVITLLFFQLSVAVVFLFMGVSGSIAFIVLLRHRLSFCINWNIIKTSYSENWEFGRWAIIGVITSHIQRYGYLYLLGALIGSGAVADVSASRLLFMPFLLIQTGWGKVTRPHGAILRENNQLSKYFKELVLVSLGLAFAILIYAYLILSISGFIGQSIFTEKYETAFDYVLLWSLIFSVTWVRANASFGLQVIKKFKALAKVNIITMFVTLSGTVYLINLFGIKGALFAIIVGEVIFSIILWFLLAINIFPIFRKRTDSSYKVIRKILTINW